MADIALLWNPQSGIADWQLGNGQVLIGDDLVSAYIVSLFSDRLADPSDELPPGVTDRRGWWGDTFLQEENPGDLIGSRLWLLRRAKSDASLPGICKGYIAEATQWAIDDGVVAKNDIECFFIKGNMSMLGAKIQAWRPDGTLALRLAFDWAWQSTTYPQAVTVS